MLGAPPAEAWLGRQQDHQDREAGRRGLLVGFITVSVFLAIFGALDNMALNIVGQVVAVLLGGYVTLVLLARSAVAGEESRAGWALLAVGVSVLLAVFLLYANHDAWFPGLLPWVLIDGLLAVSLFATTFGLCAIVAGRFHLGAKMFVEAYTVSVALTMVIWATPYGTFVIGHTFIACCAKVLQVTSCLSVLLLCSLVVGNWRQCQLSRWAALGWLLCFAVVLCLAVLATFAVFVSVHTVVGLALVGFIGAWWSATQPADIRDSFSTPSLMYWLSFVMLALAVVLLVPRMAESARFAAVIGFQVALAVVFVMVYSMAMRFDLVRSLDELSESKAALQGVRDTDELTGALSSEATRRLVQQRSEELPDRQVSVIYIRLEQFTHWESVYGKDVSARVLRYVATSLVSLDDSVAGVGRVDTHEFVVVADTADAVARLCTGVRRILEVPYSHTGVLLEVPGRSMVIPAGVGVQALPGEDVTDAGAMIAQAELASYVDGRQGASSFTRFSAQLAAEHAPDRSLGFHVSEAVASNSMSVAYQPIISGRTGQVAGFEALARWRHEGRNVSPGQFIPLTEQLGITADLTRNVLHDVCDNIRGFQQLSDSPVVQVSLNLSSRDLNSPDLVKSLLRILAARGVPNHWLAFEVTESAPLADVAAAARLLGTVKESGVGVYLDDFGTGNNSLSHLMELPLSRIKFDHTTTQSIHNDPNRAEILRGVVAISHQKGCHVVAEGIESAEQYDQLLQMGVDYGQGFHLGRPMPADHWLSTAETQPHGVTDRKHSEL